VHTWFVFIFKVGLVRKGVAIVCGMTAYELIRKAVEKKMR
jgi:hypothetical protein